MIFPVSWHILVSINKEVCMWWHAWCIRHSSFLVVKAFDFACANTHFGDYWFPWAPFAFFACHSALRLVEQEPEPSQATAIALTCCFLGKVLGVGCHYFPPPLDIPTFTAMDLHVCTTILLAKGGTMVRNIVQ